MKTYNVILSSMLAGILLISSYITIAEARDGYIMNLMLDQMLDTDISNPQNLQCLRYNGTYWLNSNCPTGSGANPTILNDLNDVTIVNVANNQILKYNSTSGQWVNVASNIPAVLDDLTDVVIVIPVNRHHLIYNGTHWKNQAPLLDDNSDVDLSSLASANIFLYNGTHWKNRIVSGDVTISNSGVVTISANAVGSSEIIDNSIADSDISTHVSTKISIANRAQLNSQIAYEDENNIFTVKNRMDGGIAFRGGHSIINSEVSIGASGDGGEMLFNAGGTNGFDFRNQGIEIFTIDNTGNIIPLGDVIVSPTERIYLDGGSDTFLRETIPNKIDFVVGGATQLGIDTDVIYVNNNNMNNVGNIDLGINKLKTTDMDYSRRDTRESIFKSSIANSATVLGIVPNTNGDTSGGLNTRFEIRTTDDYVNHSVFRIDGTDTAYRILSTNAGTGALLPIILEMNGNNLITLNIDNSLSLNNRLLKDVKFGNRVDVNGQTFGNTDRIAGTSSGDLFINANNDLTDVTERGITFQTINSATDSLITIFRAIPNGANPNIEEYFDHKFTETGDGLFFKEGSNAIMGVCTLVAGTCTVNTNQVTASSRIFVTPQDANTGGVVRVTARTAGTSFTLTSTILTDTGVIAWIIIEPS